MGNEIKYGLSEGVIDQLESIFIKYTSIDKVVIFGSRAKGTHHHGSDIDLAVYAENIDSNEFSKIWNDIDMLPIIYKADILHFNKLENQSLKENIAKDGIILWKKA